MEDLLRFLERNEVWIYLLLGLVGSIYLRKLFAAWQEWRSAVFGLEKEAAQRRFNTNLVFLVVLGLAASMEFFLVTFVASSTPQSVALITPTADLLATPTPTLTGDSIPGAAMEPVATLSATLSEGCIPGELEWTFPRDGEEISGMVELKGTVNQPDLGFFKYEYSSNNGQSWVTIAAGSDKKTDQTLGGVWNTGQLVPGDYLLRLVITDSRNNVLPACVIRTRILAEE